MESIESASDHQAELNSESAKYNGAKSIWDRFQTIPLVAPPLDIIETAKSICKLVVAFLNDSYCIYYYNCIVYLEMVSKVKVHLLTQG